MPAWSRWLRAAAVSTLCLAAAAHGADGPLAFAKVRASADAHKVIEWVLRRADHQGRPFAVVDKRAARILVFDATGTLVGQSAALLGATFGDHTAPGVGERAQSNAVGVDERTTPAGRFDAVPGRNLQGEHVVWADYASAFAIHRNRPGKAWKARELRLATSTARDKRVTLGCVVVPVAFYQQVVEPVLGTRRSVVYVLPETQPLQALFGDL